LLADKIHARIFKGTRTIRLQDAACGPACLTNQRLLRQWLDFLDDGSGGYDSVIGVGWMARTRQIARSPIPKLFWKPAFNGVFSRAKNNSRDKIFQDLPHPQCLGRAPRLRVATALCVRDVAVHDFRELAQAALVQ
jgi:hypothetical protein